MGFVQPEDNLKRVTLFRDVLVVYKNLLKETLKSYNLPENIVQVRDLTNVKVTRAPLIIISRGAWSHVPRSLRLSESLSSDNGSGTLMSHTGHILDYPITFTSYGNSFLEAEQLGIIALETLLSSGMSIVALEHPNIMGAEFESMTETQQIEGGDSNLASNTVAGRVSMLIHGKFSETIK